jgi:hypothetical protein
MLTSLLITLLVAGDRPPADATHKRHVRPLSNIARTVVDEAVGRSPTIADMIAQIERLDVILYLEVNVPLSPSLGATTLMWTTAGTRFIKIALNVTLDPARRMELLAHELQHALEIAHAGVHDDDGMRRLFRRIGWELRSGSFETAAAVAVERKVRRELGAARPKPQLLP